MKDVPIWGKKILPIVLPSMVEAKNFSDHHRSSTIPPAPDGWLVFCWLIGWLLVCLVGWFIHWLVHWLTEWLVSWLVCSLVD